MTTTATLPQRAPAPGKATSSITLQFGLVSVPVKVYTATEDPKTVERHQYTPAGNAVGYLTVDKTTGAPIATADIVKMATVDGVLVDLSDEEIATVTGSLTVDKSAVAVETLVPAAEIGRRYLPVKSYQVRPDPKVPSAGKAYRLLVALLAERDQAALVRFAVRGNLPRFAAITADGRLQFLHFDGEIREELPVGGADPSERELEMGRVLLDSIPVGTPDLTDTAAALIGDYLTTKIAGGEYEPPATVEAAPVMDLMAALEASVATAKAAAKPARKAPARKKAA